MSKHRMPLILLLSRWWSITAFGCALALLGFAHFLQEYQDLSPCTLCLKQRDIYWIAAGVSGVASVWALFTGAKGPPRVFSFVLFAIFLTGAAIAIYHAGAEAHWWDGPKKCSSDGKVITIDDLVAFTSGLTKPKLPHCDVVVWSLWGLSMAGWNAVISLGLAAVSLIASMRLRFSRFGLHPKIGDAAPTA